MKYSDMTKQKNNGRLSRTPMHGIRKPQSYSTPVCGCGPREALFCALVGKLHAGPTGISVAFGYYVRLYLASTQRSDWIQVLYLCPKPKEEK